MSYACIPSAVVNCFSKVIHYTLYAFDKLIECEIKIIVNNCEVKRTTLISRHIVSSVSISFSRAFEFSVLVNDIMYRRLVLRSQATTYRRIHDRVYGVVWREPSGA